MKAYKNLYYTGLSLILIPIIVVIVVFYFSSRESTKYQKPPKQKVVYDTVKVKVKVYDTVIIKKIKYIEKPKRESTDSL